MASSASPRSRSRGTRRASAPSFSTGWRIVKRRFAPSAFDGEGARRYGSRWTSPGRAVVFLSESPALACLEVLVHLQDEAPLAGYALFRVDLAGLRAEALSAEALPRDWRSDRARGALRTIGDEWLERDASDCLEVPSAVVPAESNLLVRPEALGGRPIEGPLAFDFDPRLRR